MTDADAMKLAELTKDIVVARISTVAGQKDDIPELIQTTADALVKAVDSIRSAAAQDND